MNTYSKKLLSFVMVLAMVLSMTPVITIPAAAEETTDTRSHPVTEAIAAGATEIWCDHCQKNVAAANWKPISDFSGDSTYCYRVNGEDYSDSKGIHIYLNADVTTSLAGIYFYGTSYTYNLHLNGYDLTSTAKSALNCWADVNVIGNGIVAGYGTSSYNGVAVHSNLGGDPRTVNLYGGTYTSYGASTGPVIGAGTKGINVNILSDTVTVDGNIQVRMANTSTSYNCTPSQLKITGGTVNGYISVIIIDAYTLTAPVIDISGGTFNCTDGLIFESSQGTKAGDVVISGGVFNNEQLYAKDQATYTIAPVITGGTFSWDPTSYVSGCNAATKTDSVWTVAESHNYVDGICSDCQKEEPYLPAFEPEKNDGYAYCEACYRQALAVEGTTKEAALEAAWKQWEVCDVNTSNADGNMFQSGGHDGKHYYLTANQTVTKKRFMRVHNGITVCLNLNGYNIVRDNSDDAAVGPLLGVSKDSGAGDPTFNIMDSAGTAVVTGRGSGSNTAGSALWVAAGELNVYGGTFRRTTEGNGQRVATAEKGTLRLYGGTIDGRLYDATNIDKLAEDQLATRSGMAVYIQGADADTKGIFEMHGGTIYGGTLKETASHVGSAAVQVGYGSSGFAEFTMTDGAIYGGANNETATAASNLSSGSVSVHADAVMNMSGGSISGGWSAKSAGNLFVAGTLNMSGDAEIFGTAYDPDAETPEYDCEYFGGLVYVASGGELNMSGNAELHDGSAASQAGNLYLAGTSRLNMSGNAKIYNGIAGSRGGNIRAYTGTGNTTRPVIVMSGNAMVYGGFAERLDSTGALQYNNEHNIWIGNGDLIMKDNATVHGYVRDDGVIAQKSAIALTSGSRLVLDGNATIVNQTGTSARIADIGSTDTLIVTKDWTGTVYLNDCTVDAETGKITGPVSYCGTFDYDTLEGTKDETATGTFAGKLYYYNNGSSPIMGMNGDLYTAAFGVVTENAENLYTDVTAALTDYATKENAYLKAYASGTLALSSDTYVDLNGKTITVTGTGKLYAMDSGNDDFVDNATLTVADGVDIVRDVTNPVNGNRYINVTTGYGAGTTNIKSYRVEIKLTAVSLRASKDQGQMGIYYKATISSSVDLANRIATHGVVLSLVDMPGADFLTDLNSNGVNENGFTAIEEALGVSEQNAYTVTVNSGAVFGIMKSDGTVTPAANAARGEQDIFANAYLEIDADGDGESEFYMADTDTDTSNDVAWSLFDVVDAIDNDWDKYTAAQNKVKEFYTYWAPYGMSEWASELPKIAA